MTRVVIDTNVFVSSVFSGKPRIIIDLWKRGEIALCLSAKIVDEYIEVLRRIGLENEKELGELLSIFAEGYNIVFSETTPTLHIVKDDPGDDMFIECAVALECSYIISGDNHLKSLRKYMRITIVSPKEFLELSNNYS